ncbi:MAG: membrane protein insertase YidC [Bacteroidales bacterium]
MDRNSIVGLVLIFAIFLGWSIWMTPSKEEMARQQRIQDSLRELQYKRDSIAKALAARQAAEKLALPADSTVLSNPQSKDSLIRVASDKFGPFAEAAVGKEEFYTLENDLIRLKLTTRGGRPWSVELKNYKTFDSLPLILFDSTNSSLGLNFFASRKPVSTSVLFFEPEQPGNHHLKVSGNDSLTFKLRLYAQTGDSSRPSYIEYRYTLKGNDYMLGFDIRMVNMDHVLDPTSTLFNLQWNADMLRQEKNLENERNESTIYYCYSTDKEVKYLNETKDDKKIVTTSLKWLSFKTKFFVSTLIAKEALPGGAEISTFIRPDRADDPRYNESMSALIPLEYRFNPEVDYGMNLYFGPNKYKILRTYKLRLERQIPLGWSFILMWPINVYAVIPVFNWLSSYGLNYGIIILILTILLKIGLLPLTYFSYLSTAKMRVLKPEIEEINKKYPKKEDAIKKQQATMELYRKAGVNPMAGCLPMLLQFPILIAMFRFFPSSIELRQQPFLWAHDLSSYDSVLNLPFNIPFYGDHVSLFTLLMTISTLVYTWLQNKQMDTGQQQLPGMKTMMYIMPIMFLGIFNNYSAGLSYYYFLANVFTFIQMFIFRRIVNEDKLHARIQANKAKPAKKSAFQRRLEEMAKQRGMK